METENPIFSQQSQEQEELSKITKGGATDSNSQPVIPVATQPRVTLNDVGRRY